MGNSKKLDAIEQKLDVMDERLYKLK
jgi:hypothetical protein